MSCETKKRKHEEHVIRQACGKTNISSWDQTQSHNLETWRTLHHQLLGVYMCLPNHARACGWIPIKSEILLQMYD